MTTCLLSDPPDTAIQALTQRPLTAAEIDERARAFRAAMAQVPAAVHVVTTGGPAGLAGFTATAVTSLSDTPPMLLVCLQKNSSAYDAIAQNGVLCVHTLNSDQEDISRRFGGKLPMDERFAGLPHHIGSTGSPLLDGARARFDCVITQAVPVATHDVLVCRVIDLVLTDNASSGALLYLDRRYRHLRED